jgi:hypothetical protein
VTIVQVHEVIQSDKRISVHKLTSKLDISVGIVDTIVLNSLGFIKIDTVVAQTVVTSTEDMAN